MCLRSPEMSPCHTTIQVSIIQQLRGGWSIPACNEWIGKLAAKTSLNQTFCCLWFFLCRMFQIRSKEENRREITSKSKICKYNPSSRHHVLKSDLKLQNLMENLIIAPYKQIGLRKWLILECWRKSPGKGFQNLNYY